MEKISDVLPNSQIQFNSISGDTHLRDAIYKMYCERLEYLVVEDNNKFSGILTEHDIVSKLLFSEKPLTETPAAEFMSTDLPVVTEDDSLEYAMQLLEHHNSRYLAVYQDFTFKAILTAQDLLRQALKKRQDSFPDFEDRQKHSWNY